MALGEVLLCSGVPTQLLIIQVLGLAGLRPFAADGALRPNFVFLLSMADAVLLLGLILFFVRIHGEPPRAMFLGRRPVGREALLGVLLTPVVFLIAVGALLTMQRFLPWLHNLERNPLQDLLERPLDIALFAVVAVIAGGLREEAQRAFVLTRFEQHLGGAWVGLVLFSVAFGLAHLLQGYDAAITTGALGAFWGALYLARRSMVAAAVSHSAFNLTEIVTHVVFGETL